MVSLLQDLPGAAEIGFRQRMGGTAYIRIISITSLSATMMWWDRLLVSIGSLTWMIVPFPLTQRFSKLVWTGLPEYKTRCHFDPL